MPVDQMNGFTSGYASLPSDAPFHSVKDYQDYIARLHQIPRVLQQATANMRSGLREHLVPPRYLLEKTVLQAQDIAGEGWKTARSASPCANFPDGISAAEQKALRDAVFAAVTAGGITGLRAPGGISCALNTRRKGRTEYGVWALPDGDARYRYDVKQMTTTDMSPEEIHQWG
jgi:uncharacterized protein (DUF885 family)